MTDKERLLIDMMIGFKYMPLSHIPIIGPTEEEWIEIVKRQKKAKRKSDFIDFLAVLFLILGWTFCILAAASMMTSFCGALFFIPAIGCALGLKKLPEYI